MAKYDIPKIAAAIKEAAAYAKACADFEGWDDGGTCNFDAPMLPAKGMTKAQAAEIERLSGVRNWISSGGWFGRRLMISGGLEGQAMRRTKMAEAMKKHLEAAGFEVSMYYQMD